MKEIMCGYVYDSNGYHDGKRLFEGSPENAANFIAFHDDKATVITDAVDQFVVSSMPGGFLDRVANPKFRDDILKHLMPLQMGEKTAFDPVERFKMSQQEQSLQDLVEEKGLNTETEASNEVEF